MLFKTIARGTGWSAKLVSSLTIAALIITAIPLAFLFPSEVRASTVILSDDFGTGSTEVSFSNPPDQWEDGGISNADDAGKTAVGSGNDSASPDGGRFAKVYGKTGWICAEIDSSGYTSLNLSYYWRGDTDTESNQVDDGIVEYRASGSCTSGDGWSNLATHDLFTSTSTWSANSINLPTVLENDSSFFVRFRTNTTASGEDFRIDGVEITGEALTPAPGGDPDNECSAFGYDFGIAKYEWDDEDGWDVEEDSPFPLADYSISVTGDAQEAEWTASPTVAAVIAKSATFAEAFPGGGNGTVDAFVPNNNNYKDLSHITFCGNYGSITVVKEVVDDNEEGPLDEDDFTVQIEDGEGLLIASGEGEVSAEELIPGTYYISEEEQEEEWYEQTDISCVDATTEAEVSVDEDGKIILVDGKDIECTITNTYDIPAPDPDPIENSCALPDTESGPAEIAIGVSPEVTLQSILDTAGYSFDADDDQANYQTWQTNGFVDVSFSATFLKKIAGAGSVFGYYTDGDLNSFEPLFRVGTHDDFPAVAEFSEGQNVAFSVENFDDIGFAVHIQDGETKRVYATERILNSATEDHAIVYNPESNEYVLAFEDRPFASGDEDYNDLVVKLEVTGCEDAPLCTLNQELLVNGGFETPEVTHGAHWDIFPSGTTGLGWLVEWFGGSLTYGDASRPEIANMELQENGLSTWTAKTGTQWTELDSDWGGPDVSLNGEPGSVAISQTVGTEVGKQYTFSFEFSPRPGTAAAQNVVEVLANGTVIGTVGPLAASGVLTEWTHHSFNFVATTTSTTFTLRDAGTPNDSLGTFIDDASLMCTVPMATISASKVVCDAEEYLPNWGDGLKADTSSAEPITATTAQEWVDQSNEHCWLANDWKFQWAPDGTGNPGDDVEHSVASGWTTFGPTVSGIITVQVPAANLVWVREELKPGYIGFTGQNSDQDVSAEFYCDLDVFNYDNYDFISPAVANQTYHCVAFNAPVEPPPGAPTLTIVKQTDGDDDTFEFDIVQSESLVGSLSTTTSGAIGTTTTMTLEEGTYSIWEIEQLDWDLTNVQCVYNGDSHGFIGNPNGHQIVVHNGDEVICTFTNVEVTPQCPEGTHYDEELDECVESNGDSFSDLSIVKTVDDETPDVGQQITYTITLTNEGPHGDGNIVVSDLLPAGVSYVSHTASAGTYEENVGLWSVPSLGDEGSATLTIVVEVGSGEEGQLIINTATILESDSVDEDSENDSDDASITVNSGGGGGGDDDDTPPGGGIIGLTGGAFGGGIVAGTSTGEVLGESCGLFMDKYLRFGKKNDVEQTKNLQEFLNKWMQSGLPITGFFGPLTLQAVMDFQNQYAAQVLTPWGLTSPTGIVYITTLRWMNLLECPDLALELPELVEWSKNPGVPL